MKAWYCSADYSDGAVVVFAETRGKAKVIAMSTYELEDYEFTKIQATRMPQIDKYYRGKDELDWDVPEDRLVMVRYCGFTCDHDTFDPDDCETCVAKDYCDLYETHVSEMESFGEL